MLWKLMNVWRQSHQHLAQGIFYLQANVSVDDEKESDDCDYDNNNDRKEAKKRNELSI